MKTFYNNFKGWVWVLIILISICQYNNWYGDNYCDGCVVPVKCTGGCTP